MRILIISLPRTGSTSLLKKISKEKNLKPLFEPFDGTNRIQYKKDEDNIVVKTIVSHHPNNLELLKNFDEVILLTRKNIGECIESHSYQTFYSKTKKYNSNNPYVYEEVPINVFEECKNDIINWDIQLRELSNITGISITYYEDLFNPKGENRLRLNKKRTIL